MNEIKNSLYLINSELEGLELLRKRQFLAAYPPDDHLIIEHEYIGFNHYDLDIIKNYKKYRILNQKIFKSNFFIPGIEAIGRVVRIGKNVNEFKIGEKVLYVTSRSGGAYAKYNTVHKNLLISGLDEIDSKDALAVLSRGIMAHNLLRKVYIAKPGETTVLITNPMGALGHILAQMCRFLSLRIIAAINSDNEKHSKRRLCESLGIFDLVIDSDDKKDLNLEKILNFTNGLGVDLVIDTIGSKTLSYFLDMMIYCGTFVSLGQNSGQDLAVNMRMIQNRSIFLTRPSFFDYKSNVNELRLTAFDVLNLYLNKNLSPRINKIYSFDEINTLIDDANNRKISFLNLIKL